MTAQPLSPAMTVRRVLGRTWRSIRESVMVPLVAVAVEVGLRVATLPTVAARLGVRLELDAVDQAHRTAVLPRWTAPTLRATDRVMRHWPWGDTCLRRSLVLGHRLRRLSPVLRLGVRSGDERPEAHAWLELSGGTLDPDAATFEPLVRNGAL
jgi:hypothetical protein